MKVSKPTFRKLWIGIYLEEADNTKQAAAAK